MIEIMGMGGDKKEITLPPSCLEPKDYKPGDDVEYTIKGKVVASHEMHGVTISLEDHDEEEDYDDMSDKEASDAMGRNMKKKMGKDKLEEYE